MIRTVIVDDEAASCEVLESLINVNNLDVKVCEKCYDIDSAIHAIRQYHPDIIFLDIELADGSGFEVLEHFIDLEARIIFVTAYEHYALKAIKYNAFDFILKPVNPSELGEVLKKVVKDILNSAPYASNNALLAQLKSGSISNKIAVPSKNGYQYYKTDDIIVIEGEGSYSRIHLADGRVELVSKVLKDFEKSLVQQGFIRTHKSYLANIQHIDEIRKEDGGYLIMSSKKQVPISTKNKDAVVENIKAFSNII